MGASRRSAQKFRGYNTDQTARPMRLHLEPNAPRIRAIIPSVKWSIELPSINDRDLATEQAYDLHAWG